MTIGLIGCAQCAGAERGAYVPRDAVFLEQRDELAGVVRGRLGVVRERRRGLRVDAAGEVREHLLAEESRLKREGEVGSQ